MSIESVSGGKVNIPDHSIGHAKQKLYMYKCPIPNSSQDRATSLYSFKIVDKKEILCTVSNTHIYCSCDKVGTVYLVYYSFENSTINLSAICNWCEDMVCCLSVQCRVHCTVE
jgi:hypothetical protein